MEILLLALNLFLTFNLWLLSKADIGSVWIDPWRSLGQISALLGAVLLSINYLLSARFRVIEDIFGGLDKVYKKHQLVGILAFVLLLQHPVFLALNALPNKKAALLFLLPSTVVNYNLGLFALWLLIVFLVLTLFVRLPYQFWLFTHRLTGIPLLLAVLHSMLIASDMSSYFPLRFWVLGWLGIGVYSYVYKVFLYRYLAPKYRYTVQSIGHRRDIVEMILVPRDKKLTFLPGQFVYLSVKSGKLPKEAHPFSIASEPQSASIRLAARKVGDFTERLADLSVGDEVVLFGPYGRFSLKFLTSAKDAVWIAGGIGITPFLSLIRHELLENGKKSYNKKITDSLAQPKAQKRAIDLFYCSLNEGEAIYDRELEQTMGSLPGSTYHAYPADTCGLISAAALSKIIGNIKDRLIMMCGPAGMMSALSKQFVALGVPARNIIYEDFNLL